MSWESLCIIWFLLLGLLLTGYAILDGFDLGVGILHPFLPKTDQERRLSMNSIGPLWDGNEVWLVTFGGALFAAFPEAYAAVFSGFYSAFIVLLFALIFRAVSMEFRGKQPGRVWRRFWDWAFFFGSTLATFLFGVAIGNTMQGIPLDGAGNFVGTLGDQLGPFPLTVGLFSIVTFALHGVLFLLVKTDAALQQRAIRFFWVLFFLFLACYVLITLYAVAWVPLATEQLSDFPIGYVVVGLTVLAVANLSRCVTQGRFHQAFFSSCAIVAGLLFMVGMAIFPRLVVNSLDPATSVTIYSAASSPKTLGIMLTIAIIGMPFVLGYTALIYWAFRGKVKLSESSY